MASVRNMTSGKPGLLIFSFALPLMVGNLFQQLYTVADAMIVGQVLGVEAIAAVGATEWMIWLSLGMIQGFTQGFSIWMAQEFGAGHPKKLRNIVANSVFLSAVIALLMLIAGQLCASPVLYLLNTPAAVFPNALAYMRTMFAGIPVVMAYNLLASILRSLGDGKTPLYAMICAAVLNIALDLLFVIVFHMGVAGAAAATVIAQFFSGVFCFLRIRKIDVLKIEKSDCSMHPRTHLHLLKLGFPMAFQNAVISVGGMIVQFVVNGFGVIFIAGFTATNKLYGMLEVAATSYGFAMTTYTGQNMGAGKPDRIRQGYISAMAIAVVTSLVIMAIMILGGRPILSCFISGDAKTVADTLDVAYHYLFIMSVCLPILYFLHVTRSCIQGMGNTVLPMLSGFAEFFMRTGAALLLPRLMGQEGIFYAEIAAWLGADLVLLLSFLYCMKKLNRMFS
ncbi:MAG: MATE family efflux transporter [Eubacteriales bacterium]|nr:MATE family efflux transporter [Eubacteriales bacterium]